MGDLVPVSHRRAGVGEVRPEASDEGLFRRAIGAVQPAKSFHLIQVLCVSLTVERRRPGRMKRGKVGDGERRDQRPMRQFRRTKMRRSALPLADVSADVIGQGDAGVIARAPLEHRLGNGASVEVAGVRGTLRRKPRTGGSQPLVVGTTPARVEIGQNFIRRPDCRCFRRCPLRRREADAKRLTFTGDAVYSVINRTVQDGEIAGGQRRSSSLGSYGIQHQIVPLNNDTGRFARGGGEGLIGDEVELVPTGG